MDEQENKCCECSTIYPKLPPENAKYKCRICGQYVCEDCRKEHECFIEMIESNAIEVLDETFDEIEKAI